MRAKAYLNLRYTVVERAAAFAKGLEAEGFEVVRGITHNPGPDDIFVTWSRIGAADDAAEAFIAKGRPVLVAENASWGNEFAGKRWYTIARTYHNQSGRFPIGGTERWDSLGIELQPWRAQGETVILPQRGIGPVPIAMPRGWGANLVGRVRKHPGRFGDKIPLEEDLKNVGKVITWGSGSAIKALMLGIPVESHMPSWIGQCENTDEDRLRMFRELSWAQFTLPEIESGFPFRRLLGRDLK